MFGKNKLGNFFKKNRHWRKGNYLLLNYFIDILWIQL